MERITPNAVFDHIGLNYAGPLYLKEGCTRKPIILKAHVCVFILMSVKTAHLKLVSDLTTDSFLACLRRFVARRGKPSSIWSDHGTNFVGANHLLKELHAFLPSRKTEETFLTSVLSKALTGTSFPRKHLILEVAGRLL